MRERDPAWLRLTLIGIALVFLGVMLVAPLAAVFIEAFRKGALPCIGATWQIRRLYPH